MSCRYLYDPRHDWRRGGFASAAAALDVLIIRNLVVDESVLRGLRDGSEALAVLVLAQEYRARTDGVFSQRMLEADDFLRYVEHAPGCAERVAEARERRAELVRLCAACGDVDRERVERLRDYFFAIAESLTLVA